MKAEPDGPYRMNRRKVESQTPWHFSQETFERALRMFAEGWCRAAIRRELGLNKRALEAILFDTEAVRHKLAVQRKLPEGYEHPMKRLGRAYRAEKEARLAPIR